MANCVLLLFSYLRLQLLKKSSTLANQPLTQLSSQLLMLPIQSSSQLLMLLIQSLTQSSSQLLKLLTQLEILVKKPSQTLVLYTLQVVKIPT